MLGYKGNKALPDMLIQDNNQRHDSNRNCLTSTLYFLVILYPVLGCGLGFFFFPQKVFSYFFQGLDWSELTLWPIIWVNLHRFQMDSLKCAVNHSLTFSNCFSRIDPEVIHVVAWLFPNILIMS